MLVLASRSFSLEAVMLVPVLASHVKTSLKTITCTHSLKNNLMNAHGGKYTCTLLTP